MIAKNIITEEIIRDLDPSNDDNLYYQLDKREWEFIEEFSQEAGFPARPIAIVNIDTNEKPIYTLNDLINIQINTAGNFFHYIHRTLALHLNII